MKENTRKDIFPDLIDFEEPEDKDENDNLIKEMLESTDPMVLYFHLGKLGYVKISAEARVWAYLTCIA